MSNQTAAPVACPDDARLSAFCAGALNADEIESIALHVEDCEPCQEAIERVGARAQGDVVEGLLGTAREEVTQDGELGLSVSAAELSAVAAIGRLALEPVRAVPDVPPPKRLREYVLGDELGQGGMGRVYRAVHTRLNREVALKILSPRYLASGSSAARFDGEMRALGKLSHPNIVQATDAGEVDGVQFLVMELIDGENLSQRLARTGPFEVAETCEVVRQVCLGLQVAHERHIVHRDIKPSNVMLTNTDGRTCAKVMDLGLAHLREDVSVQQALAETEVFVGTFDYVAPEQVERAALIDERADIYSLGCTFFHLLTGEAPYRRHHKTALRKLIAHASAPVPRVDEFRADVPSAIVELIARMMSKSPSDRPASARDVAATVEPFASGKCDGSTTRSDFSSSTSSRDSAGDVILTTEARASELSIRERAVSRTATDESGVRPPHSKVNVWIGAAFVLLVLAGIVFRIETDMGNLEIEAFDEAVKIEASRQGQVEVLDTKTNSRVRLKSGEWQLRVVGRGDVVIDKDIVTLKRGVTEVAKLSLKPVAKAKADDPQSNSVPPSVTPAVEPPVLSAAEIQLDSTERLRRLSKGVMTMPSVVAVLSEPPSRETTSRFHPMSMAYSPDGKWLAVGMQADVRNVEVGPGTIELLDAVNGRTVRVWKPHTAAVMSLVWTRDGKRLLSGSVDGNLVISDAASGVSVGEIPCEPHENMGLALDPEGTRLAVSSGKQVRIVDLSTLSVTQRLEASAGKLSDLAFIDSQTLVSHGFQDSPNHVWTLGPAQPSLRTKNMHAHFLMRGMAVSRLQPHLVWTTGYDGRCIQWDTRTFEVKRSLEHQWVTASVTVSPDERWLVTSEWNGSVWMWNAQSGARLGVITAANEHSTVKFAPEGKHLAVADFGRPIRVVDIASGEPVWPKSPHQSEVVRLTLSADNNLLASAAMDSSVMLWDVASKSFKQPLHQLRHWGGVPNSLEFRHDNQRLIAVTNESYITTWNVPGLSGASKSSDSNEREPASDPRRGDLLFAADATNVRTVCSAIDDAGKLVALGRVGDTIDLWSLETKKQVRRLTGLPPRVASLAFSPDARWLWAIHNGRALRWDLSVVQPPKELALPAKATMLERVGSLIAIADETNKVRGYDATAEDLTELKVSFELQSAIPVTRLRACGPDLLVLSSSSNQYARWNISTPEAEQTHAAPFVPPDLESKQNDFLIADPLGLTFTAHDQNCVIVGKSTSASN